MIKYYYSKLLNSNYIFYLISFLLLLTSVFFKNGFYNMDEHYQILEPLAYKLDLRPNINAIWEFGAYIRPWFQTYIFLYLTFFFKLLNINDPFIWAFFYRLFCSLIGFSAIIIFYKSFIESTNIDTKYNKFLYFSFWFFPFLFSKASSESLGISLFIISFCLIYNNFINHKNFINLILPGIFLGLSIIVRYQVLFLAFPFLLWLLIYKTNFLKLLLISFLVLFVLFIGLIFDYYGYGFINITYYQYYYYNLVVGIFDNFGLKPWWYYIHQILIYFSSPVSLIFLISSVYFFIKYPKHVITWIFVFYFIIFSFFFGHKEYRFIFLILFFLPYFYFFFIEAYDFKLKKIFKIIVLIIVLFSNINIFIPSNKEISLFNFINNLDHKSNLYTDKDEYIYNNADLEPYFYTHYLPHVDNSGIFKSNNIYFITKKYNSSLFLNSYSCDLIYSSYPYFLIKIIPNWQKENMSWFVFQCSDALTLNNL